MYRRIFKNFIPRNKPGFVFRLYQIVSFKKVVYLNAVVSFLIKAVMTYQTFTEVRNDFRQHTSVG